MDRLGKTEILEALEAALAAGVIYNVEYKELKDAANRRYERARNAIMKSVYLGSPEHHNNNEAAMNLYYDTPTYLHLLRGKKFQKLLDAAGDLELAVELRELVERWGRVADLLAEVKPLIQKGRKPSTDPKKTPERTLDNTGTCACCGRNVKLTYRAHSKEKGGLGAIVDHGFQVPWYGGGRTCGCFGVGHAPIETSDEGLKALLKVVTTHRDDKVAFHGRVERAEAAVIKQEATRTREAVYIEPTEEHYSYYQSQQLRRLEYQLKQLNAEIERLTKAIETWKPTPLPKETKEEFEARVQAFEAKTQEKAAQAAPSGPSCVSEATVTSAPVEGACPACGTFQKPRWCPACGGR